MSLKITLQPNGDTSGALSNAVSNQRGKYGESLVHQARFPKTAENAGRGVDDPWAYLPLVFLGLVSCLSAFLLGR